MRPARLLLVLALLGALFAAAWFLTGRGPDRTRDQGLAGAAGSRSAGLAEATGPAGTALAPGPAIGKPGTALAGDAAVAAAICRAKGVDASGAQTLFGHLKQYDVSPGALVAPPGGFGGGNCSAVHRDLAPALAAMIAAADAESPGLGRAMVGISCHRSAARQAALYCSAPRIAQRGFAGQAHWVAPPGFSEHATGRSIDFGDRGAPGCNVEPCFAGTAVGRWLAANARRFGFALSFPPGNAQGVAYEPWHYRYVGGWSGGAPTPGSPPPVPLVMPEADGPPSDTAPPEEPPPPPADPTPALPD